MSINHQQWECPLDKSVQLNIYRATIKQLFKFRSILLPVYQRRYCWNEATVAQFWKDLVRSPSYHFIGKFVVFESDNGTKITVLDGQQRVMTSALLLAAIRDRLLQIIEEKSSKQHKRVTAFSNHVTSMLFSKQVLQSKHTTDEDGDTVMTSSRPFDNVTYASGEALSFVRFIPTYTDRKSYYDVLSHKHPNFEADEDTNPYIHGTKRYFDRVLASSPYPAIWKVFETLTTKFCMTHVGIDDKYNEKGCQLYQWFFEKQLLAAKLLQNKRPGEKHTVHELFKNYILSYFITPQLQHKSNEIYQEWISIERMFGTAADRTELDLYLMSYIETHSVQFLDIYRDITTYIEESLLANVERSQYARVMEQFVRDLKEQVMWDRHYSQVVVRGFMRECFNEKCKNSTQSMIAITAQYLKR